MKVTKEMTINDVLNIDASLADILTSYGMHCFGCPFSRAESLEDACKAHGNDVEALLAELNAKLA
nr:DUF1858 domain-containing protein [Maliibacterium massiliense]